MTTIAWERDGKTIGKVGTHHDDKDFTRRLLIEALSNDWRRFGQNGDKIIITSDNERS